MEKEFKKQSDLQQAQGLRKKSDAIRTVREFQKKYRENIPVKENVSGRWKANASSSARVVLKQKSYG